jgi:CIC family chloride channel protein
MRSINHYIKRLIHFIQSKLTPHQFLILASILVGLVSGFAAVVLKYAVHSIEVVIARYVRNAEDFIYFALLPLIGIALTVLYTKYLLKGRLKKGSAEITYAITKQSSILPRSQMYAHIFSSAVTVGFGGSVGLESPMVSTGAAIGSNFGRVYQLTYKQRTILLACGAAAGIAAAFNSPIAGVLFSIEVLVADASAAVFIPLIVSAACGALVSKTILEQGVLLSFTQQLPFDARNTGLYILLGLIAGFVSLYYARTFQWIEQRLSSVSNPIQRVAIGGACLFGLLIVFPPLYGEGYETIKTLSVLHAPQLAEKSILAPLLKQEFALIIFLGALVFMKSVAASLTLSSGGNGGNFGPSLFVGAYLGYVFAHVINLSGIAHIHEVNFTLVGMAGILSGVFYAPLTAIFLIAEITGGYALIIPLMIVSALSVTVARYFKGLSMEGMKLARMLKLSPDDRDHYLLSRLDLPDLIESDFAPVHPDDALQSLVSVISKSHRNVFPVVDNDGKLVGIVHLNNVRDVIFQREAYEKMWVRDLMSPPDEFIMLHENLHQVLQKFERTKMWNLPVVEDGQYRGFLSKSSILARYRDELVNSA